MNSLLTGLDRFWSVFLLPWLPTVQDCAECYWASWRWGTDLDSSRGNGVRGQGVVLAAVLLGALLGALAMFSLFYVGVFLFGCSLVCSFRSWYRVPSGLS